MPTCTVNLICPPMGITHTGWKHWLTRKEPVTVQVLFDGGRQALEFGAIIPATEVDVELLPFKITVQPCECSGGDGEGNSILCELPEEPVVPDWRELCLVAKSIIAPTTLTLADGSVWKGDVTFPDCRVTLGGAAGVTATGTLVKQ